jgi:hypothetical protein
MKIHTMARLKAKFDGVSSSNGNAILKKIKIKKPFCQLDYYYYLKLVLESYISSLLHCFK